MTTSKGKAKAAGGQRGTAAVVTEVIEVIEVTEATETLGPRTRRGATQTRNTGRSTTS